MEIGLLAYQQSFLVVYSRVRYTTESLTHANKNSRSRSRVQTHKRMGPLELALEPFSELVAVAVADADAVAVVQKDSGLYCANTI